MLFKPDTLVAEGDRIPRDRDIVLYCTCPSDATSARTALRLRNLGIYRVRPLHGGYDGWKKLGYPLEPMEQQHRRLRSARPRHPVREMRQPLRLC